MDPFLARTMVESLSKGVDPLTGRVLPKSDSCYGEEVQDALLEVLAHCTIESNEQYLVRIREEKALKRKETHKKYAKQYPCGGDAWTAEEERRLLDLHRKGCNIYQIANTLQRTPGAIETRLKKLQMVQVYRGRR